MYDEKMIMLLLVFLVLVILVIRYLNKPVYEKEIKPSDATG